ncbi:hypothetical protein ACFOW1_02390 [Parasediminibacterium paludis]|uniref:Lipoprotein n=1 Tax=Parasediminibacterium paludis TaxID=908966 RepID=A0ABV8PTR9_9BACT
MKKISILLVAVIAAAAITSCKNADSTSKATKDSAQVPTAYAYTIEHPDNWEIGSSANTATALSALKSWEKGKFDECVKYFADTTQVMFDGMDKKLSNDSLKVLLIGSWNNYKNVSVTMKDWESVIAKDKSEEWVTLWYVQYYDDGKGAKDSVSVINDVQIKNSKIVKLAEYTRKFH